MPVHPLRASYLRSTLGTRPICRYGSSIRRFALRAAASPTQIVPRLARQLSVATNAKRHTPANPRRFAIRFLFAAAQVLALAHAVWDYLGETSLTHGASMYPTLALTGDRVLISPWLLHRRPLERGQLVTAVSPIDSKHYILKRIIGLPGDTICVDPSGERDFNSPDWQHAGQQRLPPSETFVKVPPGHVWLVGDNASNSTDSRDFGPVPIALLRATVVARIWPWRSRTWL